MRQQKVRPRKMRHELSLIFKDIRDRRKSCRPPLCCTMYEVERYGQSVFAQNENYTTAHHTAMATDDVRVSAFRMAIQRAAKGKRVLDVGSGPFLLLSRLAVHAGAAFVASVEDSATSVQMAVDLCQLEHQQQCSGSGADCVSTELLDALKLLDGLSVRLPIHVWQLHRPTHRQPVLDLHGCPCPLATLVTTSTPLSEEGDRAAELQIFHGLSSEVTLPRTLDLIVHEVIGHVMSAEGAVLAIHELKLRYPRCKVIPRSAGTFISPTAKFEPSLVERLLFYAETGDRSVRPRAIYRIRGFPASSLLAPAQPFEWFDFEGDLPLVQHRTCTFRTTRSGMFDGVHLHVKVQVDDATDIDTYQQQTTWACTYIRLLSSRDAIWLPKDAVVVCECFVDVSSYRPKYTIDVLVALNAVSERVRVTSYSWQGDG